jgi:hypothetical protein
MVVDCSISRRRTHNNKSVLVTEQIQDVIRTREVLDSLLVPKRPKLQASNLHGELLDDEVNYFSSFKWAKNRISRRQLTEGIK